MGIIQDKLIALTRQLYPTGRAFKMMLGGDRYKLHAALALSEERAWLASVSILNSAIPDNADFTAEDASAWERRLGLITNPDVPLADRKLAIIRKMNHPGTSVARQSPEFLQKELRAAGFDVYVYRNKFSDGMGGYITKDPLTVTGGSGGTVRQHGQFQHGQAQHGSAFTNIVVNHIDEEKDAIFDVGNNLRSTFYIGGTPIGTFANVDADRKAEFRQLILKVKPAQTVGYLIINYV